MRDSFPLFESLEPRLLLDGQVVISEFMAINATGLQDYQGDRPDWLEIHNPGTEAVDLTDWKLRDSNDEWVFPSMSLGPGEFRVIFASRKNLRDPAAELHTNFALTGDGEYLGLLDDAGVPVHVYNEYPPQFTDVSYGIGQDIQTTEFVPTGDSARYLIPDGDVGDWTALGFDDGAWQTGETAFGFADTVPGFAVWNYTANTSVGHLTTALQVIANPAMQSGAWSANCPVINFFNSGGQGHYTAGEVDFPGSLGEMDDFATEMTGFVTIPSAGQWTFGVNSDDGFQFTVQGAITTTVVDSTTPAGSDTMAYADPRGPADTFGVYDIPQAGVYEVRLVFYERGGGSGVELFAAQGAYTTFGPAFDLVGDTASGGLEVHSQPVEGGGGGGTTFSSLIETDVQDEMKDVNASMFLRIPFSVADPAQLESLTLRMKYDDGYVAYLNGQQVASRNAPGTPTWNSHATDERTDLQATIWQNEDLSAYLGLLNADDGTGPEDNVLAIHGLNYAADDGDFLILPELLEIRYLGLGEHFFAIATPGDFNTEEYWMPVEDTKFSHDRGFYDEQFSLTITSATEGAEIYYTTDGSEPSETNGTLYTTPITIRTTTVVRAAAFKAGYAPTDVDTQTYLFLDDIVDQPSNPEGFPTTWGGTAADYQMDPDVVDNDLYKDLMRDSLLSIPTMSIVADTEDLFGANSLHANPWGEGVGWERPTSVEWINPDGTTGFHVNAGLRIYGGAFRGYNLTRKKTFRLLFKAEYGPTKLDFPMFGEEGAATSFDTIILRGGANDAWNNWGGANTQYVVDEFMRRTQLAFGGASGHGTFVHLYLNGLYWGLYNPCERPESSFAATYFGGDKEEWDALNSGEPTGESNTATWNAMMNQVRAGLSDMASYQKIQGNNPDGTNNPAYDDLLDVDNYIDYMLSNFWGGTGDWPHHNWYAACRRPPDSSGWKSFNWDSEGGIVIWSNLNANVTGVSGSIADPYAALRNNPEFRMLFADHIHRNFFNDGAAAADASYARYKELADEVALAIIAESARWGDQARATPWLLSDWEATRDYILNTYMPQRPGIVLNQLKSAGFYPNVVAPSFNVNGSYQHGGTVDLGDVLTIQAPAGTIYCTTDGSDPRPLGGGAPEPADQYSGPITLDRSMHVKSRVYRNGEWSALNEATYYVSIAPHIRITEMMYHPSEPTADEIAAGFTDKESFEFIEIKNISATKTLPLGGMRFTDAIDFTFPEIFIGPGEYVVVVQNEDAFNFRYDTFTGTIAGHYDGFLRNTGERVQLDSPVGGVIQAFEFKDGWYGHTDGEGFSLTIRDPEGALELWDLEEGWRASAAPGGTPGYDDTLVTPGSVVITEVLAHSDAPYVDMIELHNVSDSPVNVSGWFLSDQKTDDLGNVVLTKYQIPTLPAIGPGEYRVLYESTHFGTAFALSELGDDVYLSSNSGGVAGGYREHVDFGASPRNVSFGLYTKSTGGTDFTLLSARTFGGDNAYPYIEDLVINEVMYHPADPTADEIAAGFLNDDDFEFVEIYNASSTKTYTLTEFYLSNGIGFTFGWYDADDFSREAWTLEPGATATWNASLPGGPDTYEVFARWDLLDAEGDERDLDGQARYAITHVGGTTVVIRDQKPEPEDEGPDYMDGEGWVSLGTYDFDGSGQVVLTRGTNDPGNWTIADQVKFVSTTRTVVVDDPALDSWYTSNGPASIGPGQYVVVVRSYDAFDERYDVAANGIAVAGSYTGNLSNDGEKVKLMRVGSPEPNGFIPYYRVDYVNYDDVAPWPVEPDGQGLALARLHADEYGNDPANWEASNLAGTPGAANIIIDRTAPSVPDNLAAQVTVNPNIIHLTWDASVDDESYVDHYVIYRGGGVFATSPVASFDDTDVTPATPFSYQVSAVNRDGYESDLSFPAVVTIPGILTYAIPDRTHVQLIFSEALDPATAEVLDNYVFTGGTLVDVTLAPGGTVVSLTAQEEFVIGTLYSVTVNNVTTLSGNEMPDGQQVEFYYEPQGSGEILWQYWTGIVGQSVDELTASPNYPDNPTGEDRLTSLEAPTDWAEEYGARILGYIHPPKSGTYTFWVSSDDNSQLYLSSDANPDNKALIAYVPGWTEPREWTRYPEQQSAGIYLAAGQKYYIEVLHKEGGGGDNVAVRWQLPDGSWENPNDPNAPIPGIRLSPWVEDPTPVAQSDSYEVTEGGTLFVPAPGVLANDYDPQPGPGPLAAQLVDGPDHAESFSFLPDGSFEYTPAADYTGSDTFSYRVCDGAAYSVPATVHITVVNMVRILSVDVPDETHVGVLFSADLDEASAETLGNYAVNGGLAVQSASLGGDLRTVTLTLSPAMNNNQQYTLTVSNVRDASLAYVIAPDTQVVFQHVTWLGQDIGLVGAAGSHDEDNGVWTIEGSGEDIWDTADEFHFVYQPFSGDGTITARVVSVENTNDWAKVGVMFRDTLDGGSAYAMTIVTPTNGVCFQRRLGANQTSLNTAVGGVAPHWVRVVREGSTFTSYASANGSDWTLIGSDTLSLTQGTIYVGLAVTSHNDGVLCTAVFDNVSISSEDTQGPTADIIDVDPDFRMSPVESIDIAFNEAVTGFDIGDLTLTRNSGSNLLTAGQSLSTSDNVTWRLSGLTAVTSVTGTYRLTLTAAGSGIEDATGNALVNNASDVWQTVIVGPTVDIVDVSPDPRNAPVSQIQIVFSEAVTGFDVGDLSLTRDGAGNLLGGTESLISDDGATWTLGDIEAATAASGSYVLTLTADGSEIEDAEHQPLTFDVSDAWLTDATAPTADIIDVDPDPRKLAVEEIVIVFSEPVGGLDISDLSLTRDGQENLLTGEESLSTTDNITWTLGGLAGLTGTQGPTGSGFIAFNDHAPGDTHPNTTSYSGEGTTSGKLRDITTGATTGVTLTVTTSGIHYATAQGTPAPGTDAYNIFDGYVDFAGTPNPSIEIEAVNGDYYTYAFSGLDTTGIATYNFAGTATRGSDTYTNRWTRVILVGAEASTAAHSSGNGVVVISPTEVAIWTGHNTAAGQGFVAAWNDIDPGDDGQFSVVCTQYTGSTPGVGTGTADGPKGYGITGMRLEEVIATGVSGDYELVLVADGSDVVDVWGNPLAADVTETWKTDNVAPTVDLADVAPDPRCDVVDQIDIVFSEPVTGFDIGDLSLTRNGGANLLGTGGSLGTSDNVTWTLGELSGVTADPGEYVLTLTATGSGIVDELENAIGSGTHQTSFRVALGGDTDLDDDVDFTDYVTVKGNFNTGGASWADGDSDGDGDVDFFDYITAKGNFGQVVGGSASVLTGAAAGEPAGEAGTYDAGAAAPTAELAAAEAPLALTENTAASPTGGALLPAVTPPADALLVQPAPEPLSPAVTTSDIDSAGAKASSDEPAATAAEDDLLDLLALTRLLPLTT